MTKYTGFRFSSEPFGISFVPATQVDWLREHVPDAEGQRLYAQEAAVVAASEAVAAAIEGAGLTRSEVASRIGKSKQHVTKALSGRNVTMHTLADLLWACGFEVRGLRLAKLGVRDMPARFVVHGA